MKRKPVFCQNKEHGSITLDFLFALVLILGFTVLLFALTFTLTMTEITQYITFASARSYMAAHMTEASQRGQGNNKYQELINHPTFRRLYNNGWFQVSPVIQFIGATGASQLGYTPPVNVPNLFVGAGTQFSAPILDFNLPFYGSTTSTNQTGGGFDTFIASYLTREINTDECIEKFVYERWKHIRNMHSHSQAFTNGNSGTYVPIADNGC